MALLTADFLAKIPIFRGTTEPQRSQLLQVMRSERYAAGSTIIEQGSESRGLHLITVGKAAVILDVYGYTNPAVGDDVPPLMDHAQLATLEIGSTFGEIALLDGGRVTATVRAETDLELLTLPQKEFHALVAQENVAALRVAHNAGTILAQKLRNADRMIGELVLAQHDPLARSNWFSAHHELHMGPPVQAHF